MNGRHPYADPLSQPL